MGCRVLHFTVVAVLDEGGEGSLPLLFMTLHTHPKNPPTRQAIRAAPDGPAAKAALCAPPFKLSEPQAEGVLGLTLRRLTGLEVGKLKEEQAQLTGTIAGLQVGGWFGGCCC
jgi:hypothetical protein